MILLGNGTGILVAQDPAQALLHCLEGEPIAAGRESIAVLAVLFAWAILSESPSMLQLCGVGLVLCGLLIVSAGRRTRRPAAEPGYVAAGPQESLGS